GLVTLNTHLILIIPRRSVLLPALHSFPTRRSSDLLSEPEAGSDATSQRTTAEDKGDHYLLNGTKNWITNGGKSMIHLVMAQSHRSEEHTSELQSREKLVCRLLLEKKKEKYSG